MCVGRPLAGVDVAISPLITDRRRGPTADHRAGRDRRGLRPRGSREGPLRPALGDRAGQLARPRLAPYQRRRPARRRLAGCGSRAGSPTSWSRRTAWSRRSASSSGSPCSPASARPQWLASDPAELPRWWSWSCSSAGVARRARRKRPRRGRATGGRGRRGGRAGRVGTAGRHPAPVEDRPRPRRGVGRAASWPASAPVVDREGLVTGATSMIGAGLVRALVARGDDVTALQRGASGLACREVRGDGRPTPPRSRPRYDGQDAVVHLAAKVHVVGDHRDFVADQHRRHAKRRARRDQVQLRRPDGSGVDAVRRACRRRAGRCRCRAGRPSSRAGPLRADQGRGRTDRTRRGLGRARCGRHPAAPGLGAGRHPAGRAHRRAGSGRPARVGRLRRGPGRHDVRRQRGGGDGARTRPGGRRCDGEALVVSNGEPRTVAELLRRHLRRGRGRHRRGGTCRMGSHGGGRGRRAGSGRRSASPATRR